MFDTKQFDDLAQMLFATLPTSLQNIENDIQQKFKEVLQATFARMDLITRDEFDVQCKVLTRTREKLEQLQKQVDELLKAQESKNQEI
ncbi:accessory factor UbiK family protein [Legionella bononiensis]|uniref:Ubiquinone biosynthesis accessory factor UbiK n=1 Tax=Legionella bononiensis TaxID=2793102 RepID=A0ABS1W6K5_9GAMM|nr:accessory factor UbiK family protein [Legionella bononiensis]MBL7478367.1 accessory factor UbiK family protein [Legionella bononiensis]MBL7524964.1 accessory factor UbiK family protein [Legionella bononiensis]MBL7561261.1 accessory factor UbiK family protein [Legionella bononiensis]